MTQIVERTGAEEARNGRLLWLICSAHFVSHFYILMLAPLFPLIRADFGVSYTEMGLALTVFNVTSAVFQTWTGYLVDRRGAGPVLTGGLLIGAAAVAGAALLPTYWGFVAMFAVLGLANTVYHPADYALLSRRIPPSRLGQAFSLHGFAGMAGSAAAPPILLMLAHSYSWRGAYLVTAGAGLLVALVAILFGREMAERPASQHTGPAAAEAPAGGVRLLSTPILLQLAIFILLALTGSGLQNFSVVALGALHGMPLAVSNAGLSVYLALSALGVLAGGYVASRTARHDLAAALCLGVFAVGVAPLAFVDPGATGLLLLFSIVGLANGIIMPSRDMMVRAITPPGAAGTVFAFVTNGFSIAGIVTPLLFGWLMDHGSPQAVFLAVVAFSVVTIPLVLASGTRNR